MWNACWRADFRLVIRMEYGAFAKRRAVLRVGVLLIGWRAPQNTGGRQQRTCVWLPLPRGRSIGDMRLSALTGAFRVARFVAGLVIEIALGQAVYGRPVFFFQGVAPLEAFC